MPLTSAKVGALFLVAKFQSPSLSAAIFTGMPDLAAVALVSAYTYQSAFFRWEHSLRGGIQMQGCIASFHGAVGAWRSTERADILTFVIAWAGGGCSGCCGCCGRQLDFGKVSPRLIQASFLQTRVYDQRIRVTFTHAAALSSL